MKEREPILASGRGEWAFNDVFEVPDYDDPTGEPYLVRRRIISTPWFGIYLHKLNGPDPRRTFHNHPWSFVSVILSGWYDEINPGTLILPTRFGRGGRRVNRKRHGGTDMPNSAHYIIKTSPLPCWTLMLVGPRKGRTWGYWERRDPQDFDYVFPWKFTRFDEHRYNDEFQAALKIRRQQKKSV